MTVSAPTRSSCPLDAHELAVLTALADGLTQDTAARRLEISPRTLRRHLRAICVRIDVREPIEAVAWAARNELL